MDHGSGIIGIIENDDARCGNPKRREKKRSRRRNVKSRLPIASRAQKMKNAFRRGIYSTRKVYNSVGIGEMRINRGTDGSSACCAEMQQNLARGIRDEVIQFSSFSEFHQCSENFSRFSFVITVIERRYPVIRLCQQKQRTNTLYGVFQERGETSGWD